jgi:hypothetical protein
MRLFHWPIGAWWIGTESNCRLWIFSPALYLLSYRSIIPVLGLEPRVSFRKPWILNPSSVPIRLHRHIVGRTRIELVRGFPRGILSPLRLPIPPSSHIINYSLDLLKASPRINSFIIILFHII